MKTERASVLQDNNLVKMVKYMGWDPEDRLTHLWSMFKLLKGRHEERREDLSELR